MSSIVEPLATKSGHFSGYTVKADRQQGVVGAYIAVYGVQDAQDDVVEPGTFAESIKAKGPAGTGKIRVFAHNDPREVIGRCIVLLEHTRLQLPAKLIESYPTATGGLYAETRFNLKVQRGHEVFALYRDGDLSDWAIHFNTKESRSELDNGKRIRHITKADLWGYGPATWGNNPATTTILVKNFRMSSGEKNRALRRCYQAQLDLSLTQLAGERRRAQLRRCYRAIINSQAEGR